MCSPKEPGFNQRRIRLSVRRVVPGRAVWSRILLGKEPLRGLTRSLRSTPEAQERYDRTRGVRA